MALVALVHNFVLFGIFFDDSRNVDCNDRVQIFCYLLCILLSWLDYLCDLATFLLKSFILRLNLLNKLQRQRSFLRILNFDIVLIKTIDQLVKIAHNFLLLSHQRDRLCLVSRGLLHFGQIGINSSTNARLASDDLVVNFLLTFIVHFNIFVELFVFHDFGAWFYFCDFTV